MELSIFRKQNVRHLQHDKHTQDNTHHELGKEKREALSWKDSRLTSGEQLLHKTARDKNENKQQVIL